MREQRALSTQAFPPTAMLLALTVAQLVGAGKTDEFYIRALLHLATPIDVNSQRRVYVDLGGSITWREKTEPLGTNLIEWAQAVANLVKKARISGDIFFNLNDQDPTNFLKVSRSGSRKLVLGSVHVFQGPQFNAEVKLSDEIILEAYTWWLSYRNTHREPFIGFQIITLGDESTLVRCTDEAVYLDHA